MRPIDADALVEAIKDYPYGFRGMIVCDIAKQPTIEPKRGECIRHVLKNANVPLGYDCSACGAWFVVGDDTVEKYYYCPNCGARMDL